MNNLPKALEDIIIDYKQDLDVIDTFKASLTEIKKINYIIKSDRLGFMYSERHHEDYYIRYNTYINDLCVEMVEDNQLVERHNILHLSNGMYVHCDDNTL